MYMFATAFPPFPGQHRRMDGGAGLHHPPTNALVLAFVSVMFETMLLAFTPRIRQQTKYSSSEQC